MGGDLGFGVWGLRLQPFSMAGLCGCRVGGTRYLALYCVRPTRNRGSKKQNLRSSPEQTARNRKTQVTYDNTPAESGSYETASSMNLQSHMT